MSNFIQIIPEYVNPRSMFFGGINQYINKGKPPELDLSTSSDFTFCFYFKLPEINPILMHLISKGDSSLFSRSYTFFIRNDQVMGARINGISGAGILKYYLNDWNHIVITINSGVAYYYLNAGLIEVDTAGTSTDDVDVLLGAIWVTEGVSLTDFYKGYLAEVGWFNGNFNQDEVLEFQTGHEIIHLKDHSRASDLISYNSFGDVSLPVVPDRAGLPNGVSNNIISTDISLEFPNVVNSGLGLLCDKVDNVFSAWGIRKLLKDYSGPLIRVRRDSDGMETDIYADAGDELDLVTFNTFVGVANAYVTIIYDQTGGNRHFYQTTLNSQAIVTLNGSPNNKAVISPDGTDDYYITTNSNSDWMFMIDGSENALSVHTKVGVANSERVMTIVQNRRIFTGISQGFIYEYSDAGSAEDRYTFRCFNEIGQKVIQSDTPNSSVATLEFQTGTYIYRPTETVGKVMANYHEKIDLGGEDGPNFAFPTVEPNDPLHLFCQPNLSATFFEGAFTELLMYDRRLEHHEAVAIAHDRKQYYG